MATSSKMRLPATRPAQVMDMRPPMRKRLNEAALMGHRVTSCKADKVRPVWRSTCHDCHEVVVEWHLGFPPRLMEAAKVQCRG